MGERPCTNCGEPTLNHNLCRECSIEAAFEECRCESCGRLIWADNAVTSTLGLVPNDHAPGCALSSDLQPGVQRS